MATVDDLKLRIALVRQKERSVILFLGLSKLVIALVSVVLAYFFLDWAIDLPFAARWIAVATGAGALGFTANKHLLRELRKAADDDEIALRVEARNRDLRGRLISTLQLTRAQKAGAFAGSAELLGALEEETLRVSEPLDFFRIIDADIFKKFLLAAVLVAAIQGVLTASFPGHFKALAARLLHADAQFPTRTRILDVKLPEYVARGDDLTIQVLADKSGVIPDDPGAIHVQTASGNRVSVELTLTDPGKGLFSGVLARVTEEAGLWVTLGDAHSRTFRVAVLTRPEVSLDASTIACTLPLYARASEKKRQLQQQLKDLQAKGSLNPEEQKKLEDAISREAGSADPAPEKFGGIAVLSGSTAAITLASTNPLREAQLERSDGTVFKLQKADANGSLWKIEQFPVDRSGSFRVSLVDTHGLKNSQPAVEYPIDAKPDLPPAIKQTFPAHDITVTPSAHVQIGFSARDDYALRCIWLACRLQPKGQSNPNPEVKRFLLPKIPHWRDYSNTYNWNIGALGLKPEDQVIYWLEADDDCTANDTGAALARNGHADAELTASEPQEKVYSRSSDQKLTVLSKEDKLAEVQTEVQRLYKELQTQTEGQEDLHKRLILLLEAFDQLKGK